MDHHQFFAIARHVALVDDFTGVVLASLLASALQHVCKVSIP
jgi:hypothetical protein